MLQKLKLTFVEKNTLFYYGFDYDRSEEIASLLIATEAAAEWLGGDGDNNTLYPAWLRGKRAWVLKVTGSGDWLNEYLLSFRRGVTLLIERGIYDFPQPDEMKEDK